MITDAEFIEYKKGVVATFKKKFKITEKVKSATLYASAIGLYKASINDEIIAPEELLTPGWTSYKARLQYQSYDVSENLVKGENTLSITAADGWACGRIGWLCGDNYISDCPAVIASLDIVFESGKTFSLVTDESFDVYSSQITSSGIYDGETVDSTIIPKKLGKAKVTKKFESTKLIAQVGENVVKTERVFPVEIITTPKGEKVVDFGQNSAGYVEIRAKGKKGERIVIKHFEILDKFGNVYTENLRSAKETCTYICSGREEVFRPTFTFQGYRYIQIAEEPENPLTISDFVSVVIHSDIKRTGSFSCGANKINQLYSNVIWGQKGNFIDVPTDCPQRDERLGWTGDAMVFCTTAAINFDVSRFFRKWLADVLIEQGEDGSIKGVVPIFDNRANLRISAAWGDVATVAPFQMWLAYGDEKDLLASFPLMKRWVDYMHGFGEEEYLWLGGYHYGDWLSPDADPVTLQGPTDTDLIASAFFAYSTSLVVKAGHILGKDVSEYEKLLENVKKAFAKKFIKNGLPTSETQTADALLIAFDLAPDKEKVGNHLAKLVKDNGMKLSTGFVGTPYLLPALSMTGHGDIAYSLLLQEDYPSWLYSVNRGATTIWEHWDGVNENGDVWRFDMNSFNHYAYGSVFEWIYRYCGGIIPSVEKSYAHLSIKPVPDKRLGFMNCGIDTRWGHVQSNWRYSEADGLIRYEITVPELSVADITLPDGKKFTLTGGSYIFSTKA